MLTRTAPSDMPLQSGHRDRWNAPFNPKERRQDAQSSSVGTSALRRPAGPSPSVEERPAPARRCPTAELEGTVISTRIAAERNTPDVRHMCNGVHIVPFCTHGSDGRLPLSIREILFMDLAGTINECSRSLSSAAAGQRRDRHSCAR